MTTRAQPAAYQQLAQIGTAIVSEEIGQDRLLTAALE
jgi:hypothetical protein